MDRVGEYAKLFQMEKNVAIFNKIVLQNAPPQNVEIAKGVTAADLKTFLTLVKSLFHLVLIARF